MGTVKRPALGFGQKSAPVQLRPGAHGQQIDDYTVRITCGGCGASFEASRVDDEPLRPSDIPEMLSTMRCECQTSGPRVDYRNML